MAEDIYRKENFDTGKEYTERLKMGKSGILRNIYRVLGFHDFQIRRLLNLRIHGNVMRWESFTPPTLPSAGVWSPPVYFGKEIISKV